MLFSIGSQFDIFHSDKVGSDPIIQVVVKRNRETYIIGTKKTEVLEERVGHWARRDRVRPVRGQGGRKPHCSWDKSDQQRPERGRRGGEEDEGLEMFSSKARVFNEQESTVMGEAHGNDARPDAGAALGQRVVAVEQDAGQKPASYRA